MAFNYLFAIFKLFFHDLMENKTQIVTQRTDLLVSEWLIILNNKWTIFQLYYGENKLLQWNDNDIRFVLDQYAELDFYRSASSLKQ